MLNERKTVDGELFERMVLGGVANLRKNLQTVNDLNVFPIPDGDTGENMYLTLQVGLDRLNGASGGLDEKSRALADGMLLGARGNSGVILSQLFFGIAVGLKGKQEASVKEFSNALSEGVKCAYRAVAHPVEGTILTVAREAVENSCRLITDETSVEEYFSAYLGEMKKSLERTPDLLAVLKESGVIDSGGAGLVYITEGFCKALGGSQAEEELALADKSKKNLDFSKFTADSEMEFGYCTELLLQLQNAKCDPATFSIPNLIAFLESVGDSIVAFQTGSIVKIHVHTLTPYKVLEHCQKYGEYLTVKIENMTLQHNETVEKSSIEIKQPKRARRKYATVTVATGEGLTKTFQELGADYVIFGGQTNNPSAEDFVRAFDEVNADYVFVLPNNSNVILSAKQAAEMYTQSEIIVVESKNIGQGYSALSMLDLTVETAEEIKAQLYESMSGTVTGMVAKAVRDTSLNGVSVQKDWYMGFTDKTMLVCEESKTATLQGLMEKLNVKDKEYVIVVYGKDVSESEKSTVQAFMSEDYKRVELYEIDGGQEVYDFLVIVE